jgi:hypothetical protein
MSPPQVGQLSRMRPQHWPLFEHLARSAPVGEFVANIPALGWNSSTVLELSLPGPPCTAPSN